MQKTVTLFAILMVGASLCQTPALAADQRNADARVTKAVLPLANERAPGAVAGAAIGATRKIENVPVILNGDDRLRGEVRIPGAGENRDTKLALLQATPLAAREGAGKPDEQWVRASDHPMPEPGTWAMLLAGFLGICAVARPRIFSS